ncbi:hypothetical protein QP358_01370 [Nosocomiicoccus ampullae]|nr:hypothetical protein [Nosocomiicoccus ampullae]MDK6862787.1 hypothetical protein [Nosocomiicoccus ampullae]
MSKDLKELHLITNVIIIKVKLKILIFSICCNINYRRILMRIKNLLLSLVVLGSIGVSIPAAVDAAVESPTFNGVKISWDHGRKFGVFSYSTVQTGVFDHSATANSTFSGWKKPGVRAHAEQYVGTKAATAYWNCR